MTTQDKSRETPKQSYMSKLGHGELAPSQTQSESSLLSVPRSMQKGTKSINAEFEDYVKAELGDIAVVSEGRYISPKIQNYFKVWKTAEAYGRTEQAAEIAQLKAQLADYREDYRKMNDQYQTLIIDLAPYLASDQIHMVGSRTGSWFVAMEDGKYLVRYDPRDSEAGLWENIKPTI